MRSDVRPDSPAAAERLFARAWAAAYAAWAARRAAAGRPCGPRSPGVVRLWEAPPPPFLHVEPAAADPRAAAGEGEAGEGEGACGGRGAISLPPAHP